MIVSENLNNKTLQERNLASMDNVSSDSDLDESEESSTEYETFDDEVDEEQSNRILELLHSIGLYNYWNNLPNINLPPLPNLPLPNLPLPNLPNIRNLRNTTFLKEFYENGCENISRFKSGLLTNLARPDLLNLDIYESFDPSFNDIFIESSAKKGIKDPVEKYHLASIQGFNESTLQSYNISSFKDQNEIFGDSSDEEDEDEKVGESTEKDGPVCLSEEFWSSIFSATENGICAESAINLQVPGTQTTIKAPLNPFFHRNGLSVYECIKVGFCTLLIPVRVVLIFIFLVLAWLLAWIGIFGLSKHQLKTKPLSGWRKNLRWFIGAGVMRSLFFCAGFYWVKKRGRQATREEAPILVVAPHSSFFDAFPFILMGSPSIVAKSSVANVPFFGALVDMTQALYVTREERASRTQTLNLIKERAKSTDSWPQIYIYPEGTCTNRSCLLNFKLGPFYPGVPVQPVLIKYPNRSDTITWSFDGMSWKNVMHRTLAQFSLHCELEYLDVHVPSPEEIKDPILFANNVRQEMADALGIPVCDYTYEDGMALSDINTEQLVAKMKEILKFRNAVKVNSLAEMNAIRELSSDGQNSWLMNLESFKNILHFESESRMVEDFFKVLIQCKNENEEIVDVREYFVFSCLLNHNIRVEKLIPVIFVMYAEGKRKMSGSGFAHLMKSVFEMNMDKAEIIFKSSNEAGSPIDLDSFSKKLKKRLEYLRLYALEVSDLLHVYPPREREVNSYRYANGTYTHKQKLE